MNRSTQSELLGSLNWDVVWSNGWPERQTKQITQKVVSQAWESGTLPEKVEGKRQWIVGYKVHKTFFSQSATPIMVGPKKPRLLRESYYTDVKVERGV